MEWRLDDVPKTLMLILSSYGHWFMYAMFHQILKDITKLKFFEQKFQFISSKEIFSSYFIPCFLLLMIARS